MTGPIVTYNGLLKTVRGECQPLTRRLIEAVVLGSSLHPQSPIILVVTIDRGSCKGAADPPDPPLAPTCEQVRMPDAQTCWATPLSGPTPDSGGSGGERLRLGGVQ